MKLHIIVLWKPLRLGPRHLWTQPLGIAFGHSQFLQSSGFFIRKCVLGVLPTRTALNSRIPDFPRSCPVCESSEESASHLLLWCPLATRFGSTMNILFN
ncbi:hypothetical protein LINPERHAP2_LOCUS34004 [Linum perenne]